MAASLYKFQEALKTCEDHPNEELSCFCKTCEKFICTTCAKTTHHGHEWDLIPIVAKKRRKETPVLCRKIKQENIPRCREKFRAVDGNIAEVEKSSDEDLKKLDERRNAMIDAINQIIDEQRRKRITIKERECRKLHEDRSQLKAKLEYLEKMTTSLDSNIGAYTDFDVIEMEIEMLKVLSELEAYDGRVPDTEVTFVPREINRVLIEDMVGKVEETVKATSLNVDDVSVDEEETFKEFDIRIQTIAPISSTQAWVVDDESYTIKQLSLRNKETNSVTLPPHTDFITTSNGDVIVTEITNQAIRRVTSAGTESVIATTKPLNPQLISNTQTGDILVTLRDDGNYYKLRPSSRRLVQRMTLTGKVIKTYEIREDGVTRLFTAPTRTAENGNSDICVINRTSEVTGELIVLRGDGQLRTTYRGQVESEFVPTDVACDSQKRIIVVDPACKCLHLLSPDGTFLRYLLSDMFDYQHTLALYQDSLWIGFNKGAVKVYKYM